MREVGCRLLERNNSMTGYPRFANWMAANGSADADWYIEPNASTSSFVYNSFVTGNKKNLMFQAVNF
ncbi:MAG: hypothetical protein IPO06_12600 [Leptospiraceae bacterium]|nr:hypothetical protein [Leptospiraceae bacterium]MBK9500191.1 hypothetical protein [Leptospiraceae bacterium]MBP9890036.1 hypothetical protein [Leptospiraceae bacterium]